MRANAPDSVSAYAIPDLLQVVASASIAPVLVANRRLSIIRILHEFREAADARRAWQGLGGNVNCSEGDFT
jgi:hypothetical protein